MVDAEGRIGLSIVPANVQDRDVLPALEAGQEHWPSLRLAIVDGVVRAKRCEECCSLHGMHREAVPKEPDQTGFVVLERRWWSSASRAGSAAGAARRASGPVASTLPPAASPSALASWHSPLSLNPD